jgi:PIN domain nuclease of toxin-antitoxin system
VNYLLDTHVLLWFGLDPERISSKQRAIIDGRDAMKFISSISIWEISLKFARGKLSLGRHTPEEFLESALSLGFHIISPDPGQFASFHKLPSVVGHKDPFDRMLIWQAIQSDLIFLSQDRQLPNCDIHGLKFA